MVMIYYIIKILTWPGTLFKAFLEHITCRAYDIPIEYGKYMQKNELCGHVEHMLAPHKGSFGICFMPHIVSLICGFIFVLSSSINLVYLGKSNLFSWIFIYLGISCLTNCFPLPEDAIHMWENLYGKTYGAKLVSKIFLAPAAAVMYLGAYLEKYGLTLITSVAFAYALPYAFVFVLLMI